MGITGQSFTRMDQGGEYRTVFCPVYHSLRKIDYFLCLQKPFAALRKTRCLPCRFFCLLQHSCPPVLMHHFSNWLLQAAPKVRIQRRGGKKINKFIFATLFSGQMLRICLQYLQIINSGALVPLRGSS